MDAKICDYAFFEGKVVPFSEANVSIGTHALQYGTGAFAGIRGYLDVDGSTINVFRLPDHSERLMNSAKLLRMELPYDKNDVVRIISELIEKNAEMAQLAQEYQRQKDSYAKRPKKKFLSANTKEYAYASYLAGWAARIERIGNLNYPDEARRQQLHGDVLLTVTLNKDGSVKRMDVIQGSGHKILDDAVQRIVQLAAPFPPIPKTNEDIDELYITRTWQFLPGDVLRNR